MLRFFLIQRFGFYIKVYPEEGQVQTPKAFRFPGKNEKPIQKFIKLNNIRILIQNQYNMSTVKRVIFEYGVE